MKCDKCGSELTQEQYIKTLEKEVARLNRELAYERATSRPRQEPYNPYSPFKDPIVWGKDNYIVWY
jgi:hypothetical protein